MFSVDRARNEIEKLTGNSLHVFFWMCVQGPWPPGGFRSASEA